MRPPPCHERALARVTLCDTEEDRDKIPSITKVLKSEGPVWENGPAWPVRTVKAEDDLAVTAWSSPPQDLNTRFKEWSLPGCGHRSRRRPRMLPRAERAPRSPGGPALGTAAARGAGLCARPRRARSRTGTPRPGPAPPPTPRTH